MILFGGFLSPKFAGGTPIFIQVINDHFSIDVLGCFGMFNSGFPIFSETNPGLITLCLRIAWNTGMSQEELS